jgi:hypothetical protein
LTTHHRRRVIIIVGIALSAMILLSANLSELEFSFGEHFSIKNQSQSDDTGISLSFNGQVLIDIILALFALVQLILPFAILYFIVSREARKNVVKMLFSLLWILALYYLFSSGKYPFTPLEMDFSSDLPTSELLTTDINFAYTAPPWLITVMTIGLSVLIASMLVGAFMIVWRRIHRTASPLELVMHEAQDAIDALHAGDDLKDTVMRCYFEMSRIISKQHGIRRDKAMTPREFERNLVKAGLPSEYVRQLTRLFEAVRYGSKIPGEKEEHQAISCLTRIIEFYRSAT